MTRKFTFFLEKKNRLARYNNTQDNTKYTILIVIIIKLMIIDKITDE